MPTRRRAFLKSLIFGGAASIMTRRADAAQAASPPLLLSKTGGDRATGYVMSNKVARRGDLVACTWLGSDRANRWAFVDPATRTIVRQGSVGGPLRDNHCGAAIATDPDGTLHLMLGAHHGDFVHVAMPPGKHQWQPVAGRRAVARTATYPSLVCDGKGTLHLTYRYEPGGRNARLHYCRRPRGGEWSAPVALVANAVAEHSWLTNAIEVGPRGRLHVVVSNTLPHPRPGARGRYYGGSHLYSDDGGDTWHQFGLAEPLGLPVPGDRLRRIEGDGMPAERSEPRYGGPRGPGHSYYHKILLSNLAVDDRRRPWVILHNLLDGTARLYRHDDGAGWVGTPLEGAVASLLPGFRILHCGQVSRHRDGTIEAVVMVAPRAERAWGTPGTELVRLLVGPDGAVARSELVRGRDPAMPHWLPSLERWCPHAPVDRPALPFIRDINSGGYAHNRNRVDTEVWLQLP